MPTRLTSTADRASSAVSRRNAVAGVGAIGALAVAASVGVSKNPVAPQAASASIDAAAERDGRYQLTEHVQRYYATARV